ncbi:transmembrane protein 209-like [Watersipora subatra]|uniref:transmembrane protein 209-like n=1 Tax=Watersipora subatra TaxID=2589382 RepID=UPI00355B6B92
MKSFTHNLNSSFETKNVDEVFKRKKRNRILRHIHQRWISASTIAAFLFYDLYCQAITRGVVRSLSLLWFAEIVLAIISTGYALSELIVFAHHFLSNHYIDLTEDQQRLLGVNENEAGFRKSVPSSPQSSNEQAIKFSPTHGSPVCHSSPSARIGASGIIGTWPTSLEDSLSSTAFSTSLCQSGQVLHDKSMSASHTRSITPTIRDGMQTRKRMSSVRYLSPDRELTSFNSQKALDTFISTERDKEMREQIAQGSLADSQAVSFWNVNRSVLDYVPILGRFQYQVAPRAHQTDSSSLSNDDCSQPPKYSAHELWSKLGVSQTDVDMWIENLRYWLGQSVMKRLASEITKVNRELRNAGSEDTQVGEVNVSTLKNVAFVKSTLVPTLNNIIPYLEASSSQEYLVSRIKALGNDGCLAAFNWDGGAPFKGKPWEDHLPTDSAIVMHALCTYLDARLPCNPKYAEGKAFSSEHYMSTQEKPNFTQKTDYLTLCQTKVNPPHYKVAIGKDMYDVPKGRNNLFHSILLFLHEIRTNRKGMLGNVSIGEAGVNMMWIVTHKYR